ncbi:uncharacterized protein EAE98_001093 [Botrytis deweyae]|uniref:Peptidase A1 domain-containing protein n=1 Tax=Botrytis deweyae TaxID=2478750 RepID=A0ABQ7J0I5_9HELO|nr:uncharacterized protein EAE98_001093 [Botrytis deweyae]KAF7938755.1 hypothetical protein EAE98_001093 [Botrytis deweyae]
MFSMLTWLLLLAVAVAAFLDVEDDFKNNATAKVLPNRMVDDGVFQLGVTKVAGVPNVRKRQSKSNLANPYIGDIYMITVQIGYPPQSITFSIDTGSSDVWVNPQCATSGWASFCASYPQYDPTKSTSFVPLSQALNIAYGIGAVTGAYATDNFMMGSGPTLKKLQFGVASGSNRMFAGIMGVSWGLGLGTGYYNIIDQLALQGLTKTRAFAIDLGNVDTASGSIIFGGLDTKKYYGSLIKNPIIPFYQSPDGYPRYWINMTYFGITFPGQLPTNLTSTGYAKPVIVDSGSTLSYLPPSLVNAMLPYFPGWVSKGGGLYTIPCSFRNIAGTMDFGFAGQIIRIQLAQFIWFNGATCYGPIANAAEKTDVILGDTFMRGAYVVFDQDNANVHIAQAASCGSNIVPITSGTDGVPSMTGGCPSPAFSYGTSSYTVYPTPSVRISSSSSTSSSFTSSSRSSTTSSASLPALAITSTTSPLATSTTRPLTTSSSTPTVRSSTSSPRSSSSTSAGRISTLPTSSSSKITSVSSSTSNTKSSSSSLVPALIGSTTTSTTSARSSSFSSSRFSSSSISCGIGCGPTTTVYITVTKSV